jgi:hypothetical protein
VKVPRSKVLVAAGGVALLLVVGAVAAAAESWRVAVICLLLLQAGTLVAVLAVLRRGGQSAALARLSRDVANVSARVVTESRALQSDLAARTAPGVRATSAPPTDLPPADDQATDEA